MNTINAAGYLAGALLVSRMIRRFGLAASVRWGTLACVLSLALCAMSGNFYVLSFARLLAGGGAAAGFVGGGALAATIAQSRPERANFLLSLFYAGPGIGILSSGLVAPFVLQWFGPGSWWIVWWAMTLLAVIMTIPVLLAPLRADATTAETTRGPIRGGAGRDLSRRLLSVRRRLHRLHDLHDRLCARRRRRRGGAERVLEPDRPQRFRDAMGVAPRACAQPRRPRHHDHSRRQRHRRGDADLRALGMAAGAIGAGVRRRVLRGGRLHHGLRPLQLSAAGLADSDCGDDDFIRHRPDAGPDRGRRDHGRDGQPVVCAERLGGDAGAGRGAVGVSEEGWA